MTDLAQELQPTYFGICFTPRDALVLFEACLSGQLNHVARRCYDSERTKVIKSGNIFVFEEKSSGIEKWADSILWNSSILLDDFLFYGQAQESCLSSEEENDINEAEDLQGIDIETVQLNHIQILTRDQERQLTGTLTSSSNITDKRLRKKTMSVFYNGVHHHLVSYYSIEHVLRGNLNSPGTDPTFQSVLVRPELQDQQRHSSASDGFA